jgi:predicted RNA-binding Zn ribbon-like protein
VELSSYVELAVRLVNTSGRRRAGKPASVGPGDPAPGDRLQTVADLRAMLTREPFWRRLAKDTDLAPLRMLRAELRTVFEDAEVGEESAAVRRINVLLGSVQIAPRLTGHDAEDWHLHFAEGAQRAHEGYASAAVLGVAFYVSEHGFDRLGTCQSSPCQNVFIDTSTNRSRRYCSDRCATRANVAAYRARQRGQAVDGTGFAVQSRG